MLCEPRAQLAHVNISIPRDVFTHAFIGGALFGQYRSAGMSRAAKLARTVLAPLVPPIRFWRMARTLGVRRLLSADMWCPVFLLGPVLLVAHASGEVAGYWRAVRHVEARYERFELRRLECVREEERSSLIAGLCLPDAEERRRSGGGDADAQSVRAGRSRSR